MEETTNKGDNIWENPINKESQKQSAENNTDVDADNIILKLETENMEVHHHPDLHHKPKKWKEYFIEFLMIFLAVTLGFFAEGLRENIYEKRIEKEYIESFLADLRLDTQRFNVIIPIEETSIKGLDTMLNTISHMPQEDSSIRLLYYLSRKYTMSIEPMSYSLGTITQLKNSGGLRLISNKIASDSITTYNKKVDDITSILNFATHDFILPSIKVGNKIFNAKYMLPYNGETIINLLHSDEKINMLTNDETIIAEYTSLIYQVKQIRLDYLKQIKRHKESANGMIVFFQNKYHLE